MTIRMMGRRARSGSKLFIGQKVQLLQQDIFTTVIPDKSPSVVHRKQYDVTSGNIDDSAVLPTWHNGLGW